MISKWLVILFLLFLLYLGILYAPPKYVQIKTNAMTLSPRNTDEYGTSEFVKILSSSGCRVIYGGPDNLTSLGMNDIYVLIGPDIPLSQDEVEMVREFMKRGGSVLIADELGVVNNLLRELFGAKINEDYTSLYWNATLKIKLYVNETGSQFPSQTYLSLYTYAGLDVPPTAFYKYIYQLNPDPYTFIKSINDHKLNEPDKSLVIDPNLPGYIEDTGILNISGLLLSPTPDYLRRIASSSNVTINMTLNDLGIYIFSAYYEKGLSRAYIVSDTSLFTNKYISYLNSSGSISFYRNLIEWLKPSTISVSQTPQNVSLLNLILNRSVVFDVEHYKPNIIRQRLPPPGTILNAILAPMIENMSPEQIYNAFNSYTGASAIFIFGVPFTVIGIYLYLIKYLGISTSRVREPEIIKRTMISESLTLKMVRGGRKEKKFYIDMIHGLYDYLNHLFKKEYNISLLDVSEGKIPEELKLRLGDKHLNQLIRLAKRLSILELKIREGRRFPIIYSWPSTFKKLIVSTDNILRVLGYEFMHPAKELKKLEYSLR